MIYYNCPHCHNSIRVPDEAAGRKGTCNQCGKAIRVPDKKSSTPSPAKQAMKPETKKRIIAGSAVMLILGVCGFAYAIHAFSVSQIGKHAKHKLPPAPAEQAPLDITSVVLPDDYLTYEYPQDIPQKVEFDGKVWHYVGLARQPGISLDKLIPIMFTAGERDTRLVISYGAKGQDYFDKIKYTQSRTRDKYGESRWVKHGLEEHLMLDGSRRVQMNNSGELDGISRSWYPNGQIRSEAAYWNGIENGLSRGWWENGHKQYESIYKDGKEVEGTSYDENGNER